MPRGKGESLYINITLINDIDLNIPFLLDYILRKTKIKSNCLFDTGANRGNFVNIEIAQRIYKVENIKPIRMPRSKRARGFDRKVK